jgi:malonate-semialdehyde dehydrogenase (acetylating)/methylmalonate-semialdehyde dehydrogenase
MLDFQHLIRQNQDAIAENIVQEQGKTFADAKGDVFRGLQVVEQACSLTSLLMGEKLTVAKDMETCKLFYSSYKIMCNVGIFFL